MKTAGAVTGKQWLAVGVWTEVLRRNGSEYKYPKLVLYTGSVQSACGFSTAASAVGDDRIQRSAQGYAVPDSFIHGTSEQRKRWFHKGFKSGDLSEWDTFNAEYL